MTDRLVKCYGYCNEKHKKSIMKPIGQKNHCPPCYEKVLKDRQDRQMLYDTIKDIFDVTYPTPQMMKQVKRFREELGYEYSGMAATLVYAKNQKEMDLTGVGIIPYLYDETRKYYQWRKHRKQVQAKELETQEIETISPKKKTRKNKKTIDMNGLL